MRTDLNIKNATRIIITRDRSWKASSRLYNIEIRWDYDNVYSKYCWNNEKYPLPQPIATKVAYVDPKILAIACSRNGLMYKARFEQDITNDVYIQIWRKDLRDNLEEQRRISLLGALGTNNKPKTTVTKTVAKVEAPKDIFEEVVNDDFILEDILNVVDSEPVVVHKDNISVTKVSYETDNKASNKEANDLVAQDEVLFKTDDDIFSSDDSNNDGDVFGGGSDVVFDFFD